MKKFLLGMIAALTTMVVHAESVAFVADGTTYNGNATTKVTVANVSGNISNKTFTATGVCEFKISPNSSGNKDMVSGGFIRWYSGAKINITPATGVTITGVKIECGDNKFSTIKIGNSSITTSSQSKIANFTNLNYTTAFTITNSAQTRFSYLEITYTGNAPITPGTGKPAAPVFEPAAGEIVQGSTVTITSEGATSIIYTYGEDIQEVQGSTATVVVDKAGTIEVVASNENGDTKGSATYTIKKPATPVFTPAAGEVAAGTKVTVKSEYATAIGYYFNNDESTMDIADGDSYTFTVNEATTISVYGSNNGGDTETVTATYTIKQGGDQPSGEAITCQIIFANQGWSGNPYSASNKTSTWKSENNYEFATTFSWNGTAGSTYPRWNTPNLRMYHSNNNQITIKAPEGYTIAKVGSIANACIIDGKSLAANADYTFDANTTSFVWRPNASKNNTDYTGMTITLNGSGSGSKISVNITGVAAAQGIDRKAVTITANDADAVIYYTTDGTEPTAQSTKYEGAFDLVPATNDSKTVTVKALAVNATTEATATASKDITFSYYHVPNISEFLALPTGSTKYVIDGDLIVSFQGKLRTSTGDDIFVCDYSGEGGQMVGMPIHTAQGSNLDFKNENGSILHGAVGTRGIWCNIPQMTLAKADYELHKATEMGEPITPPFVRFPTLMTPGHKYENTLVTVRFVRFINEQARNDGKSGRSYIFDAMNFSSPLDVNEEDAAVTMACRHEFPGFEDLKVSTETDLYYYNVTGIAVTYQKDDSSPKIAELFISSIEPTELTLPAPTFHYSKPETPDELIDLTNETADLLYWYPIHIKHTLDEHVEIFYTKDGSDVDLYNAKIDPNLVETASGANNAPKRVAAVNQENEKGTFRYTGPFYFTDKDAVIANPDHNPRDFHIKAVAVLRTDNNRDTQLWNPQFVADQNLMHLDGTTTIVEGGKATASQTAELGSNITTGVENIEMNEAEANEAEAEYFDLQGRRVVNPANGLYIRRQGSKVEKILVK